MEVELKKQQMTAIQLLADWSKWLITIETAGLGGIATLLGLTGSRTALTRCFPVIQIAFFLCLGCAGLFFLYSIYNACFVLFSLPGVVEAMGDPGDSGPDEGVRGIILSVNRAQASIYDMREPDFPFPLLVYVERQYKAFFKGLIGLAIALVIWVGAGVWAILRAWVGIR